MEVEILERGSAYFARENVGRIALDPGQEFGHESVFIRELSACWFQNAERCPVSRQ